MELPTIVGIFIFIRKGDFMFSWVKHEIFFITSGPGWESFSNLDIKHKELENWRKAKYVAFEIEKIEDEFS